MSRCALFKTATQSCSISEDIKLLRHDLELLAMFYLNGVEDPESHPDLYGVRWKDSRCYNVFATTPEKLVLMRCQALRADIAAAQEGQKAERRKVQRSLFVSNIDQVEVLRNKHEMLEEEGVFLEQMWDGTVDARPLQIREQEPQTPTSPESALTQDNEISSQVPHITPGNTSSDIPPAEILGGDDKRRTTGFELGHEPASAQELEQVATGRASAPPTFDPATGLFTPPGPRRAIPIINPTALMTPAQQSTSPIQLPAGYLPFAPDTIIPGTYSTFSFPYASPSHLTPGSLNSLTSSKMTVRNPPSPPRNDAHRQETVTPHKKTPLSMVTKYAYAEVNTGYKELHKLDQDMLEELVQKKWTTWQQVKAASRRAAD